MFQKKTVDKIKTHILCSVTFFLENCAVYEMTWKNTVQPDRPQITIRRMRIACWILKTTLQTHTHTHKHTHYAIFIAFHCLRAGRSGDPVLVGARFSSPVQTGPEAHSASCTMGTGPFPGVRCSRGVTLTTHPFLVPRPKID